MYALLLLVVLLGLIQNALGHSKEFNRGLANENQQQNDYSFSTDKENLKALLLLRKYDNILSSMNQDNVVTRGNAYHGGSLARERNAERGEFSTTTNNGHGAYDELRVTNGIRQIKDSSTEANNFIRTNNNKEMKGWSTEADNLIRTNDNKENQDWSNEADNVIRTRNNKEIIDRSTKDNNVIRTNNNNEIKEWSNRDDNVIKTSNNKEVKDWSTDDYNVIRTNDDKENQDWSTEADNVIRTTDAKEFKEWSNEADNVIRTNNNKQINDWSTEADNVIRTTGNKETKEWSNEADNVIRTTDDKEIKDWSTVADYDIRTNNNNEIKDWSTAADNVIRTTGNKEIKDWSNEAGNVIRTTDDKDIKDWSTEADYVIGTHGYEQIKGWSNEADNLVKKSINNVDDENTGHKLSSGDRQYKPWIKRNGKGIIESIEQTLGLRSQKQDGRNMMAITSDEVVKNTRGLIARDHKKIKHKEKVIDNNVKKPLINPKVKGVTYRPWIKQNRWGKGKRTNNDNGVRFNSHAENIRILQDGKRRNNNKKRESVNDGTMTSLRKQKEKRVNENIVRNLQDTDRSWGKQYENQVDQDVSMVKSSENRVEERTKKVSRNNIIEDGHAEQQAWKKEKETRYAVDDSNIANKNLIRNKKIIANNEEKRLNTHNTDLLWIKDNGRETRSEEKKTSNSRNAKTETILNRKRILDNTNKQITT